MKKVILSLTLMFLSNVAFSQATFGVKAGGIIATRGSNNANHHLRFAKVSYLGGIFYSLSLNKQFDLQLELLYANKGRGEANQFLIREDLHYLNLPIMLQYAISERFGVELGPEIGYLLGQGQLSTTGINRSNPFLKNFDMAINLGVNYRLIEKVFLSLRYNIGIYDTDKPFHKVFPDTPPEEDKFMGNRTLQLSVGYRLSK